MALTLPTTLSPSKVSSFTSCALAFRFSAIDQLPDPPSVAATRGSLVHLALELLFDRDPDQRTLEHAREDLARAVEQMGEDPELTGLELDEDAMDTFVAEAQVLVERYFTMEDPATVHAVGLELKLEAAVGATRIRGIIDRLELDRDGQLVVTDYKTGRAPGVAHQQGRLSGVAFYALLCQEVFGVLPARVQLLYLGDGVSIVTEPSEQSIRALRAKIGALWEAIERACEREDFRPKPGPLCSWCNFQAYCPAQGGDLASVPTPVAAPGGR